MLSVIRMIGVRYDPVLIVNIRSSEKTERKKIDSELFLKKNSGARGVITGSFICHKEITKVCHRDVYKSRRNLLRPLPSKQGQAKTGNGIWKTPGIILLIIPSPTPRIKPSKSPSCHLNILRIPIPMVLNYLLIQIPRDQSSPQRR